MAAISQKDKMTLRELAKKQLEYANTPENKKREQAWYKHNDLQGSSPMVTIEEWTFFQEVERPLTCETEKGRQFERQLVNNFIGREDIDDDRATPDYFGIHRPAWFLPFGIESEMRNAEDSIGYEFAYPINDLEKDIDKLGKSKWGFSNTEPDFELAQDAFDGTIPVRMLSAYPFINLSYTMVRYMSMETMLLSIYDYPELFHQVMNQLTEDMIANLKEREAAGHFITNNLNQPIAMGTYSTTTHLNHKNGAALSDMWGHTDSQETVGISPDMFAEFFFPYYKRVMDLCGLLNYGCCEPVNSIWDNCLSQCKNIRKLSISPWCDEEFIGDRLRGADIIYHRKPSPNLFNDKAGFNEKAYAEHIIETLKAAKGCHLEFSLRDIYSLGGDKGRAKQAVQLIKSLIEKHWEG